MTMPAKQKPSLAVMFALQNFSEEERVNFYERSGMQMSDGIPPEEADKIALRMVEGGDPKTVKRS